MKYLAQNISFNGRISVPVLTMHTTGDGLVVPENEQAYASVVGRAGNSRLLRQIFVSRAGHCAFTPAETITAAQALLRRLATGHWDDGALRPGSLNAAATALGAGRQHLLRAATAWWPRPRRSVAYRPTPYTGPGGRQVRSRPGVPPSLQLRRPGLRRTRRCQESSEKMIPSRIIAAMSISQVRGLCFHSGSVVRPWAADCLRPRRRWPCRRAGLGARARLRAGAVLR